MNISVLVLTYNEEAHLPACLESVQWSDDIHVVDSGSTDETVRVARRLGAQTYFHPFENFSAQRNWALGNVPFRHGWVFSLDADERIPSELVAEMRAAVGSAPSEVTGFLLPLRVYFLGRWIRHASEYGQVWFLRLFRRGAVRYEDRRVNAQPVLQGSYRYLSSPFDHDNRKGITDLVDKFNRYSTLEAEETLRLRHGAATTGLSARRTGSPLERRRWLKQLSMRLPLRAPLRFFYLYLWRRGCLDGAPGFFWCALMAMQEYLVATKVSAWKRNLSIC